MTTDLCPICQDPMEYWAKGDYRIDTGIIKTTITFCRKCDLFKRIVSDEDIHRHFNTIYVNFNTAKPLFDSRVGFFNYILDLIKEENTDRNQKTQILVDFGPAFGHFLEIAQKEGFETIGIEISEQLIDYMENKGLKIYRDINEIDKEVDIFTFIDTFYYIIDPLVLLESVYNILKKGGLILIRVTNFNWYAKFMKNILRYDYWHKSLADHNMYYSYKSLGALLKKAGFNEIKIIPIEKHKKIGNIKRRIFYNTSKLLVFLLKPFKIYITPGIIMIARKS
jgi:SAM-dependent methyltransferase